MAASLGELVAKSRKTILLALAILAGTLVISRVELSQHMSPLRISSKQSASELTTEVARRLAVWEAGPVWAHDDAIHANRLGCPYGTFFRDDFFFVRPNIDYWRGVSRDEVRGLRRGLVQHVSDVITDGKPLVWSSELLYPPYQLTKPGTVRRGVIFGAGDGELLARLRESLHMLRLVLRSSLDVEIYHFKEELQDEAVRKSLETDYGPGIALRTLGSKHDGKNYQVKTQGFIHTEFSEFIWLDMDSIPLRDPAELFDSVEYKQSGHAFWSDHARDHPDNAVWRVLGRQCSDDHWPGESGQLVFDKRGNNGMNLAVLHMADHMTSETGTWGRMLHGDKDAFRYSFYLLGLGYQMAPRVMSALGSLDANSNRFCGYSMLQYELTPANKGWDANYQHRPMFAHTMLHKLHREARVDQLFEYYRRPRLNHVNDTALVRTPSPVRDWCYDYDLYGTDDLLDPENRYGDGQGMITAPFESLIDQDVWRALVVIAGRLTKIH